MTTNTAAIGAKAFEDPSTPMPGVVDGAVRSWLRLEGLAAFGAGLVLFGMGGGSWLLLVPLLLLPDISAVGYLGGPRAGRFQPVAIHVAKRHQLGVRHSRPGLQVELRDIPAAYQGPPQRQRGASHGDSSSFLGSPGLRLGGG